MRHNLKRRVEPLTPTDTHGKTPWNPSRRALKLVKDRVEIPCICPYCQGLVSITHHQVIYSGKQYGEWPWVYACNDCDAYVGMHPFTNLPLGTLADSTTRKARSKAKAAFNRHWQSRGMNRKQGYIWLAEQLGIERQKCHIGWSDTEQCQRIIKICQGEA